MFDAYDEAKYLARILCITLVELEDAERLEIQKFMRDELSRLTPLLKNDNPARQWTQKSFESTY